MKKPLVEGVVTTRYGPTTTEKATLLTLFTLLQLKHPFVEEDTRVI